MFSTTVTRPPVWSIPLAILGVIGAGVPFFRPATEDFTGTEVLCDGEYFYSFDPSEGCAAAITRHVVWTVIILVVTVLGYRGTPTGTAVCGWAGADGVRCSAGVDMPASAG